MQFFRGFFFAVFVSRCTRFLIAIHEIFTYKLCNYINGTEICFLQQLKFGFTQMLTHTHKMHCVICRTAIVLLLFNCLDSFDQKQSGLAN